MLFNDHPQGEGKLLASRSILRMRVEEGEASLGWHHIKVKNLGDPGIEPVVPKDVGIPWHFKGVE